MFTFYHGKSYSKSRFWKRISVLVPTILTKSKYTNHFFHQKRLGDITRSFLTSCGRNLLGEPRLRSPGIAPNRLPKSASRENIARKKNMKHFALSFETFYGTKSRETRPTPIPSMYIHLYFVGFDNECREKYHAWIAYMEMKSCGVTHWFRLLESSCSVSLKRKQ